MILPRACTDPPSPEYISYFMNPRGKYKSHQLERLQSCLSSSAEACIAGGLKEEWRMYFKSHWKGRENEYMLSWRI